MRYNMQDKMQVLRRFFAKFVHDVLPTALASLVGGFLLTHFGFGRVPEPPATQAAAPASAEMMNLLRDEHALVVAFVNAQVAKEKSQLAAADAAARAAADTPPAAAMAPAPMPRPTLVALAAAKPVAPREKPAVIGASLPPLVVAQAQPNETAGKGAEGRDDSLLARTIDGTIGIKDHAIAVTQRAVSAIGSIPSWFSAIGDRIGGDNRRPPAELVSAL